MVEQLKISSIDFYIVLSVEEHEDVLLRILNESLVLEVIVIKDLKYIVAQLLLQISLLSWDELTFKRKLSQFTLLLSVVG